jgi:Zn-dependent protease with chaperone function
MSLINPSRCCILAVVAGWLCLAMAAPVASQEKARPSVQEVNDLLAKEPFSQATWPAWRGRMLAWLNADKSDKSDSTDKAFEAARAFIWGERRPDGELPPPLQQDAFAWYLLGNAYLAVNAQPEERQAMLEQAERALRKSIQLDPKFARAYRSLAFALYSAERKPDGAAGPGGLGPRNRRLDAQEALEKARQADPEIPLDVVEGIGALIEQRYGDAERHFTSALGRHPDQAQLADFLAQAIVLNQHRTGKKAPPVAGLVDRFPNDGHLACMHAVALAQDEDFKGAVKELNRAKELGVDPADVLPPKVIQTIEEEAAPGLIERFAWLMLYFGVAYAGVMFVMALAGLVLAGRTRGSKALQLLGSAPEELITEGQVARSASESSLGRIYGLALMLGLILFYVAIPFIVIGLLGTTALLLYAIFHMGRIPIKLVAIVVIFGIGAAWSVLKSLFARSASGAFGLQKTAEECPRLHQLVREVADRVNTRPVDAIFVGPDSSIGVHQEGRGPFGMFGTKRRVLTLGLSSLNFLTAGELKSILAHEYAHFSHSDTFYSRFIYRVAMSIGSALEGMGAAGGWLNYFNPFYWFLVLYYKAYSLLSAGYSRSREYLADRMAAVLYGSDVFTGALTKVCTDGALFEATIYQNISGMLAENKAFVNMYVAFREYRDEHLPVQEREELYQKLLAHEESLFASHPTFKERIEVIAELPRAHSPDTTPAMQLFENPEEIEKELTEFMTAYVNHMQQLQAQARASE